MKIGWGEFPPNRKLNKKANTKTTPSHLRNSNDFSLQKISKCLIKGNVVQRDVCCYRLNFIKNV